MKTLFKKENTISLFLVLVILLITVNTFFVLYNESIVVKNNALQNETEEVKQRTAAILTDIVHGADLSVRGYAITRNEKLAEPLKKVLQSKDSIFNSLEKLLTDQQYDLTKFTKMKHSVEGYLAFSDYMISLARKDSMNLFVKLLNEDRGYEIWKNYEAFYLPLFKYEDAINEQAVSDFQMALARNRTIQLLLFLIGVPLSVYIMYKLRSDAKKREAIERGMIETNRIYVFDSGESTENLTQEDFSKAFIQNFQKANSFISSISNGNYAVKWEGLSEANLKVNKDTLAGKLGSMRDQLIAIEQEEGKRKWINEGLTKFSELVRNHQKSIEDLSLESIRFLSKYLHAQQGSFFVLSEEESEPHLRLTACFAFDRKKYVDKKIALGSGLIGQAFLEGETVLITKVPQDYLHITSGLGDANPTCLIIVPLKYNEKTEAIIELASFVKWEEHQIKFLERCGEFIASALQTVKNYEITNRLLKDSQHQSEELKAQEEEMRQNLEELEATQEASRRLEVETQSYLSALNLINESTASIEFSPDGEIIKANKIFLELMRYTQEEIKGKHHSLFIHESFISSKEYKKLWSDLRLGLLVKGVFARIDKTGNTIWLNGTYAPMRDLDGRVVKIIKLAQDVTESKKAEQAFERLSLVANNTDNSVIITSKQGLIEYVNLGFTRMTGYSAEEVMGKKPGQILQGPDTDKNTIQLIRGNLNAQKPFYAEIMNYHKNGDSYWISLAINPVFDGTGELSKYIAIQTNVTETKLKALDFSSKLTAIDKSYGVIEFDTLGTILDVNENFLKVVGYNKNEVVGHHHRLFVSNEEKESNAYKEFWHTLGVDGKFVSGEFERVTKNGEHVWLKGSYNAIVDLNGKPYKVVKYVQDISRQRKLEREMLEQQVILKGVSNAIDLTLATIEFDPQGYILTANENFLQLMDYSISEIEGMHHRLFVHHELGASQEYLDFWQKLNQGDPQIGEVKRITRGGDTVWLNASYTPVKDGNGNLCRVIKFAQDITKQKLKTLDFEGQANAIDNTMASIEFSLDGLIANANQKFLSTSGYSLDEIQGKHHRIFTDAKYAKSEAYINFWKELSLGHSQSGEFQRIGKDGKNIWLSASYTPVKDTTGKVYKIIKFAQDITSQKIKTLDFEGQFRAFDDTIASIELSVEGFILNANQKFLDNMDYSLEEIKGKHHRVLVSDNYKKSKDYTRFWEELRQGFAQSGEFLTVKKNGTQVLLSGSYQPVKDANGRVSKIISFIISFKNTSAV